MALNCTDIQGPTAGSKPFGPCLSVPSGLGPAGASPTVTQGTELQLLACEGPSWSGEEKGVPREFSPLGLSLNRAEQDLRVSIHSGRRTVVAASARPPVPSLAGGCSRCAVHGRHTPAGHPRAPRPAAGQARSVAAPARTGHSTAASASAAVPPAPRARTRSRRSTHSSDGAPAAGARPRLHPQGRP